MPFSRLAAVLLVGCLAAPAAGAQQARTGVVHVTDWPASSFTSVEDEERFFESDLMPYVDTLSLGYGYDVRGERPHLSFAIEWVPGAYGILDGHRVAYRRMPSDVEMVALALRAEVYAEDSLAAHLVVHLDSLALPARPGLYTFEWVDLGWGDIFEEVSADRARALFQSGFELRNPSVEVIAFASYEAEVEADAEREEDDVVVGRRVPRRVEVYRTHPHVDVFIDLAWLFRSDRRYAPRPRVTGRERRAREDRAGRGADETSRRTGRGDRRGDDAEGSGEDAEETGEDDGKRSRRSSERGGLGKILEGSDDDDDDDDEEELLPAALVGAAAIGAVAIAGGTVGYYGHTTEAPIGLTSGIVRPGGGGLLQVAVSEGLLGGEGQSRLVAKLLGFYDAFQAPLQPALGVGVRATDIGDEIELMPSVTFGAVGNFGRVVLFGGYDVALGGAEVGIAFNFRHRPAQPPLAARRMAQ